MYEGVCNTEFGRFAIKVDRENIYVGGKRYCVNISIRDHDIYMHWLSTDEGGCELDEKVIRGKDTVYMIDLAFSLIKKYYPDRGTAVVLMDDSGFRWSDKRGKKYKTNFIKGYLLLHRKTWYEDKFNARMTNESVYREYRERADKFFDDPSKKPRTFDFIDKDARDKLEPLYNSSATWGEFIEKMVHHYGDEKYKLMYSWYRKAIYVIMDMEIYQEWVIDIANRPVIECGKMHKSGGGNTTKKKRKMSFSRYHRIEPYMYSGE
jgi:hypothetical protein